jgi:hypothetical protein
MFTEDGGESEEAYNVLDDLEKEGQRPQKRIRTDYQLLKLKCKIDKWLLATFLCPGSLVNTRTL